MLFNDLNFLPFFVVVLLSTITCDKFGQVKLRNILLLLSSYYFYSKFNAAFCILLLWVTIVNYQTTSLLHNNKRKWIVALAIVLSLIPLLFYKYTNFLLGIFIPPESLEWCHWILPVGISFYTFQALTYTIDVYKGVIMERPSIVEYALFVSFFPNILSGPIERARNILPQLKLVHKHNINNLLSGFELFSWGLFKKIVIADRCNVYTSSVFSHPDFYSGSSNALAIAIYAFQIYADFSGYSDMAIGVARMLGFHMKPNFLFPFFSTSLKSFWRKWHISLTSWFTEYLYISCGGSRVPKWRWYINLSLVFIVSGIWHGAAWTYVMWGALHAFLYIIEILTHQNKDVKHSKIEATLRGLWIFFLWAITLCVFRSATISDAWAMICGISRSWMGLYTGSSLITFIFMLLCLALFFFCEFNLFKKRIDITDEDTDAFKITNLSFLIVILLVICLFGKSGAEFVYFKF